MINDLKYSIGCCYHMQFCNSYFYGCKRSSAITSEEGDCKQSTEDDKGLVNKRPTDHMLYVMVS